MIGKDALWGGTKGSTSGIERACRALAAVGVTAGAACGSGTVTAVGFVQFKEQIKRAVDKFPLRRVASLGQSLQPGNLISAPNEHDSKQLRRNPVKVGEKVREVSRKILRQRHDIGGDRQPFALIVNSCCCPFNETLGFQPRHQMDLVSCGKEFTDKVG